MSSPNGLAIRRGLSEGQRAAAAAILWDAFAGKLGRVLRSREDAVAALAPGLDPTATVTATSNGELVGVMTLKDHELEALRPRWSDFARVYGRVRGAVRLALLGLLDGSAEQGTLSVDALAVAESARGKGVGGALLAEAERIAEEREHGSLKLEVLAANEGAIRLYQRTGYRIVRTSRLWPPLSTLFGFRHYHLMTKDLRGTSGAA